MIPSVSQYRQLMSHVADSSAKFLTDAFFPLLGFGDVGALVGKAHTIL